MSPFVDLRDLGGLLQRAGFALPVTDVDSFTLRYDFDVRALRRAARHGRRQCARRALAPAAARAPFCCAPPRFMRNDFRDPDGRVRATIELVWLSGWAPHESQQKPLAPGSAQMRLADVLKRPPKSDVGPRRRGRSNFPGRANRRGACLRSRRTRRLVAAMTFRRASL